MLDRGQCGLENEAEDAQPCRSEFRPQPCPAAATLDSPLSLRHPATLTHRNRELPGSPSARGLDELLCQRYPHVLFRKRRRGEDILLWRRWRQTHRQCEHCLCFPARATRTCSQLRGQHEPSGRSTQLPDQLWRTVHFGTCRMTFRDGIAASASNALNEHPSYLEYTAILLWPGHPLLPYQAPVSLPFYLPPPSPPHPQR